MNALITVSNKEGLIEFARSLIEIGYNIYATDGTARYLEKNGIHVRRLSELTNLKETKDIKTLHAEVFRRIYTGFFKIVVVNLYELKSLEDVDIGGVALLRASAKNFKKVIVVSDSNQYDDVIMRLKNGDIDERFRLELAIKAFKSVVRYDLSVLDMLRKLKISQ